MDTLTESKITSDKWFSGDMPSEPKRCRRCGKTWVTGHKVCGACNVEVKYARANYYWLRAVECATLDMGVAVWQ